MYWYYYCYFYFQHGETCVHMAASGGHVEVMKFLQSKGVDIHALDKVCDLCLNCYHSLGLFSRQQIDDIFPELRSFFPFR